MISSTGQSTSSSNNTKWLTDALADYAQITGIDLSTNPFAAKLEQSNSVDGILQLLWEQEKEFKKFRNKYRRLLNCVNPCVRILHTISGTLGEALSIPAVSYAYHLVNLITERDLGQAHFTPAKAVVVGIDVLLVVRPINTLFK